MNENSLPTISGTGTQSTTQNPQSTGGTSGSGASATSVQPGTAPATLDTPQTNGVPLTGQNLPTIALPQSTNAVVQSAPAVQQTSPVMTGVSILFFVLAIGIIAVIFLPAKNTTN